jgi:hypothetical protein
MYKICRLLNAHNFINLLLSSVPLVIGLSSRIETGDNFTFKEFKMAKVFLNTSEEFIDLSFLKIIPGDGVVLKPNLVKESKETDPLEWKSVITSPDIIIRVCEDVN